VMALSLYFSGVCLRAGTKKILPEWSPGRIASLLHLALIELGAADPAAVNLAAQGEPRLHLRDRTLPDLVGFHAPDPGRVCMGGALSRRAVGDVDDAHHPAAVCGIAGGHVRSLADRGAGRDAEHGQPTVAGLESDQRIEVHPDRAAGHRRAAFGVRAEVPSAVVRPALVDIG